MSEQAALAFRKLVASMRTLEKQYWARRDKGVLRQSIELEKRVDETIMKVEPKNVPQTDNGNFFILVAELRVATKQYFGEKKKPEPDKELVKTLFNTIKEKEAKIDKQLIHFQEEDFRKQGYTIQYHVMERPYKCPPHSLFQSTDEELANVMFNDYLRNPTPGTMIFRMKKYIGKDGKPLSDEEINKIFFEVIIAPDYDVDALEILGQKKNRIILVRKQASLPKKQFRSLLNGVLVQERDLKVETPEDLKTVTTKAPTAQEIEDMLFANKIVKNSKSNAIVLAKGKQLLASGVGQTSRVDALKQAIEKAKSFGFDLNGAVMASDAFFPFPDCVEIAGNEGVTAVIQPGGSIKDELSFEYCNEHGIAMVTTGFRHFKH